MERKKVLYTHNLGKTLDTLSGGGLLLASTRRDGKSNVMTIGWATVGIIWGRPVAVVLVRPSRYTYEFIEDSKVFTINVPTPEMKKFVSLCGTSSGREVDKLAQVQTSMGQEIDCVTIDTCPLVYECRVAHWNDIQPDTLLPKIRSGAYARGNFHRLYYGQILGTYIK